MARGVTLPGSIDYISTITDVREVALSGTADLDYWRERLRGAGLVPYDDDGRASLLLTALESKFRGIPFRELSISVRVGDGDEAYLAHAFNSSRLLAYAERVFFQTPYRLAGLAVDERIPAHMTLSLHGRPLFSARMAAGSMPARSEEPLWEGAIYLPGGEKVFYARLSGAADIYPFTRQDLVDIRPHPEVAIFSQLIESNFAGKEWMVRAGAVHARSVTYPRAGAASDR